MKKFLHLKRSIVDSKNQTTLVQAYLDTIRSSCYKLATPHVSPRPSLDHELPTPANKQPSTLPINSKQATKSQLFSFLSMKQSQQKPTSDQKCLNPDPTPIFFQTTPQKHSPHHEMSTNENKLDQIFQNLKSQCKSGRHQQCSQNQVMQIILSNLDVLARKKEYEESVQLIRNIIMSLGREESKFTNIANHSQMKNVGYIVEETEEEEPENSFDCSHYKSAHPSSMRYNCEQASRLKWQNFNMSQQPKLNQNSISAHSISHCHQGSSIYIEDFPEESLSPGRGSPVHQHFDGPSSNQTVNSMQSDDTNRFNQQSLSCIHEQQEQDAKSSDVSLVSVIPEETIEFKKIIYMLDANDTNKKSVEQIKQLKSKSRSQSKKSSDDSSRNLFTEKSEESSVCHQQLNRTYTQTYSDYSPQSVKKVQSYSQLLKQNMRERDPKNKTKKIEMNKKNKDHDQPQKLQKTGKVTSTRSKKQLEDIVNMLSHKYNRTVKLGR